MITISIFLALSVLLNLFLVWYTRNTLKNLLYLSENLGDLHDIVSDFGQHLGTVYELERFYGDATLTSLLEHSNAVKAELDKYEDIFLLTEEEEEEEDTLDGDEEEA